MEFDVSCSSELNVRVMGENWSAPRVLGETKFKVDEDLGHCHESFPGRVELPLMLDGRICGKIWLCAKLQAIDSEAVVSMENAQVVSGLEDEKFIEEAFWGFANGNHNAANDKPPVWYAQKLGWQDSEHVQVN